MRLVLLGAPGAGKGTQAKLLHDHFGIPQVSTGEMLRQAVQNGAALGKEAKRFMDRGELVPDTVILDLVRERLAAPDCRTGFLLDGFPRTVAQAKAFDALLAERKLALDGAVSLRVPTAILVARLSGRRTCRRCGAMYHVRFNPPKAGRACDRCGGELYQRDDDREETIEARMEVYERQSAPVYDHFRAKGLLREVDGTGSTEEVFGKVLEQLQATT